MKDYKLLDSAIKTPGFVQSQMVKCGKKSCKCTHGNLHGPYFYLRYWKLHHKRWIQKKTYLTKDQAQKVIKGLKKYKDFSDIDAQKHYRFVRRHVSKNILFKVNGMTQRKLTKVSVKLKSFT